MGGSGDIRARQGGGAKVKDICVPRYFVRMWQGRPPLRPIMLSGINEIAALLADFYLLFICIGFRLMLT